MVNYAGKLVLAPMVRAGELPTRLLALRHGADLVWGPEIIDKKLVQCQRVPNDELQTVDYVVPSTHAGKPPVVVFRTAPALEGGRVIFQLGTASPALAVRAASTVIGDVAGIDINAGCPKHFSIHAGMGAALLRTPDTLCGILRALVDEVGRPHSKPISVKIRLLDDLAATLDLVKKLCATGISNLTVHCRTTPMRNRETPIRSYLAPIFELCKASKVSLIMNGALQGRAHFEEVRAELKLSSDVGGMIAEAAEANPTVFSASPLPWHRAVAEYLEIADEYQNHTSNTKYMMNRMVPGKSPFYQYFIRCKTSEDFLYVGKQLGPNGECISDPTEYLAKSREEEQQKKRTTKGKVQHEESQSKGKRALDDETPQESKRTKAEQV
ncbi:AaceriAAR072Cp [[Ashbya] aceris (nom. inval.)]|nr:AaceriAAR072Cp [[Ashbya] aceris (nom. inval.)]